MKRGFSIQLNNMFRAIPPVAENVWDEKAVQEIAQEIKNSYQV